MDPVQALLVASVIPILVLLVFLAIDEQRRQALIDWLYENWRLVLAIAGLVGFLLVFRVLS